MHQKVTGRAIVVAGKIYVITCDKALPRHYTVAALMMGVMLFAQMLFSDSDDLPALIYAAFVGIGTLAMSWLYDDRATYRLRRVADLNMPKAGEVNET